MKKGALAICTYALSLLRTGLCYAEAPEEELLLHSYHQGLSRTDNITAAVQDTFKDQHVILNIEYLDSKRSSFANVEPLALNYLSNNYSRPPASAIAADNNALTFLRNHRDTLVPSSAIIFCGINNYSPEMLGGLEGRITGVIEETDPAGTVQIMQALPCLISEFNQVILNMSVNARDAIEETVKTGTITGSTQHDDRGAIIRISDNGAGMPDSVKKQIFDPFYTTKEVGKGSGQALTIAHNVIVKKHGGKLNIESDSGHGTTFEIKLLLKQQDGS
jgi:signal transduction histidine kinase